MAIVPSNIIPTVPSSNVIPTVLPPIGVVTDLLKEILDNSATQLNTLTNDEALLDGLAQDLGTTANNVADVVESTIGAVTDLVSDLEGGATVTTIASTLAPVIAQLDGVVDDVTSIGKDSTTELAKTLAALSTDFTKLATAASNPLLGLTDDDVLPVLNSLTEDLTNLGGDLVEGLVDAPTLNELLDNSPLVDELVKELGDTANEVVADAGAILNQLDNVVDNLSTMPLTDAANDLNEVIDDTLGLVEDLLGLEPNTPVETLIGALNGLGDNLVSVVADITDGSVPSIDELTDMLSPSVQNVGDLVDTLLGTNGTGSAIDNFINDDSLVSDLIKDLGNSVGTVVQTVDTAVDELLDIGQNLQNGTSPEAIVDALNGIIDDVQGLTDTLTASGSDSAGTLVDGLEQVITGLTDTVADIGDGTVPTVTEVLSTINPLVDDLQDLSNKILGTNPGTQNPGTQNPGTQNPGTQNPGTQNPGTQNPGTQNPGTQNPGGTNSGGTNPGGTNPGSTNPGGTNSGGTTPGQPVESNDVLVATGKQDIFNTLGGNDLVKSTYKNLKQRDQIDGGVGIDRLAIKGGSKSDVLRLQIASSTSPRNLISGKGLKGDAISNFEEIDLKGFAGRGIVRGSEATDVIIGGKNQDKLTGLGGADQLAGGLGADKLNGGTGQDSFVFTSVKEKGDVIQGFSSVDDSIVVTQKGFSRNLSIGQLADTQFVTGSQAQDKTDRFVYNRQNGMLYFDADGLGGKAQVALATLSGRPGITASDIVVTA